MIGTVYAVISNLDNNMRYVKEARENNLGDDKYYEKMRELIFGGVERLKKISCNKKLISTYEAKVNELYNKEETQ